MVEEGTYQERWQEYKHSSVDDSKLYEKAYSGLDILNLLENHKFLEHVITIERRYEMLVAFNRVRKEFRNEKLLILFILNFMFLSSELSLENISFM